jgi:hypothetical protein
VPAFLGKEEGRRKKEEGRRKKEEGRRASL